MRRLARLAALAALLTPPLGCGGDEQTDEAVVIQPDASKVQAAPATAPDADATSPAEGPPAG